MEIPPASSRSRPRGRAHRAALVFIAVASTAVLLLTGGGQIYDTNFQTLWEATAVLHGDHPYRDFYEWGLPLQVAVSAAAQVLSGHRLIGEFVVQWAFIVAALVLSTHLALTLSRSVAASLLTMSLAVVMLAATATYHYPKLFLYPLAVWLAWRYLDRPDARRGAALGVTTALAFLFRHDHGLYIGILSVVTFGLARAAVPASRALRSMLTDSTAYVVSAALMLVPWLAVVHVNEGLPEYLSSRSDLYEEWAASGSVYQALLTDNPLAMLLTTRPPAPRPAIVTLTWSGGMAAGRRTQLEREYRLRPLDGGPDTAGRWRYEVPNIYDVNLWTLRDEIENADSAKGFDWEQVERLRRPIPIATRTTAMLWIQQMVLVVPLLLLIAAGIEVVRARLDHRPAGPDWARLAAGAALLIAAERSLLREASYAAAVVPLAAALSARFFAGGRVLRRPRTPGRAALAVAQLGLAAALWIATSIAVYGATSGTGVFDLDERGTVSGLFTQLMASPPIDGYFPADTARRTDRQAWDNDDVNKGRLLIRYMADCTREDDRILATGSTPYHIHYYTDRSVAGGHVFWHIGWRSDPGRQQRLLELLQNQSVPFAFSTNDPVLTDLKRYPLIHEYVSTHYVELEGARGLLLVDARREPTSRFGQLGFPCFR